MSRKSIVAKNSKTDLFSGGFNYQKEVKQLKKDIRLRDEKIVLLNKDAANKKQTIELLQSGLVTKDEQLALQDKEILNLESKLALLNEKIEALEKQNEELQKEMQKQSKLAQIASKKQSVAEQTNLNLMTQINALAQNLNNLKNVNMALSSQLTMTMTAAQHTMQQNILNASNTNAIHNMQGNSSSTASSDGINISPMLSETSPMPAVMNPGSVSMGTVELDGSKHANNQRRESMDEQDEDAADDASSQSNKGEDGQHGDSTETEEDGLADLPESSSVSASKSSSNLKSKSSSKRMSKRMSQSSGAAARKRSASNTDGVKHAYESWDNAEPNKESAEDDTEKEKSKRKRDKDKDKEKVPGMPRQKSTKKDVRSALKAKKRKTVETEENLQEQTEEEAAWEADDDHKVKQDDLDFGNAGPVEKSKKKRKKKEDGDQEKGGSVCFDTYLDGITSDKLKITKNGRLITMDYFSDSLYIISSTGFSSGKHEWEIKTIKTGDLADEIGVCSKWDSLEVNGNSISDMGSSQLGARAVYANDPASSHSFHDAFDADNKLTYDKKFKKREFVWDKGDVIKVSLNCNKWSIKFYLNNKQVGKSIPLVADLTYYPILCAYGACSYQVISCT